MSDRRIELTVDGKALGCDRVSGRVAVG